MIDTATTTSPSRTSWLSDTGKMDKLIGRIASIAAQTDEESTFPETAFNWLAEAELLSITLPGQDLDNQVPVTDRLLSLLKRIGTGNLAVGRIYEGHISALNLIDLYGSPDQKQGWYDDAKKYDRLFSVWNTQAGDGVQIHAIGKGRYRMEGSKTFCSGAGWIHRPLVTGE